MPPGCRDAAFLMLLLALIFAIFFFTIATAAAAMLLMMRRHILRGATLLSFTPRDAVTPAVYAMLATVIPLLPASAFSILIAGDITPARSCR